MEKITTMAELKDLSGTIQGANTKVKDYFEKNGLFSGTKNPLLYMSPIFVVARLGYNAANLKDTLRRANDIFDSSGVPSNFETTPHLVRFLANDETVHKEKVAAHRNAARNKFLSDEAQLAGWTAAFGLSHGTDLHSGLSATISAGRRIMHEFEVNKQYKAIENERNAVAGSVLNLFQGTEPTKGKYQFERGKWGIYKEEATSIIKAIPRNVHICILPISAVFFLLKWKN